MKVNCQGTNIISSHVTLQSIFNTFPTKTKLQSKTRVGKPLICSILPCYNEIQMAIFHKSPCYEIRLIPYHHCPAGCHTGRLRQPQAATDDSLLLGKNESQNLFLLIPGMSLQGQFILYSIAISIIFHLKTFLISSHLIFTHFTKWNISEHLSRLLAVCEKRPKR